MLGDEPQHVVRDGELEVVLLLLLPEDGDPVLQVGLADVGHHAPLESAHQPGLEPRDLLGRPVGGQHDLLVALVQGVKRMEELLLRHFLAFEEMHVVHQEEVHVGPVAAPELGHGPAVDALDDLVDELLGADVEHPGLGLPLADGVGDGLHQVGLAQPGGAVDEEGIVGLAGGFGRRVGGGGRELVGLADDEGVEGVALVERLGAGIDRDDRDGRGRLGATKKSICGRFWRSSCTRNTTEVGWPMTGSASLDSKVACLVSFHSTANWSGAPTISRPSSRAIASVGSSQVRIV